MVHPSLQALALTLCFTLLNATGTAAGDTSNQGAFSRRPRLEFNTEEQKAESATRSIFTSPETLVRGFLADNAQRWNVDVSTLHLKAAPETLRGTNFVFQQRLNGLDVFGSQIRVQVKADNTIDDTVMTSLQPVPEGKTLAFKPKITSEDAILDIVWQHLKASGLQARPSINLGYLPNGSDLTLSYEVVLTVNEPRGAWRCYVNADSGEVIDPGPDRTEAPGIKCENTMPPAAKRAPDYDENRRTADRQAAFEAYQNRERDDTATRSLADTKTVSEKLVEAYAVIVDPDPRTATMDETLAPDSNSERFEQAYDIRKLPQVMKRDDVHLLEGPSVRIADWDPPAIAPPSSAEPRWSFKIGESGLSDVMAYYHIDRSQRYLQSLGFTGSRAIQGDPIPVDANAEDGQDNSHYSPQGNALTFGKGCAPDAEDADVILHEYGHAISHDILKRAGSVWAGGDSRAVGEGFGDYWAATSRVTNSPEGDQFHADRVFNWDAACGWQGRSVSANPAVVQYDPDCSYAAHSPNARCLRGNTIVSEPLGEGFVTDELWSTPLFRSFRVLTQEKGRPREEVDRIVLSAMGLLSEGFSMRQFAQLIVQEAGEFYPTGPHKAVFTTEFQRFGILETLASKTTAAPDAAAVSKMEPASETADPAPAKTSGGTPAAP